MHLPSKQRKGSILPLPRDIDLGPLALTQTVQRTQFAPDYNATESRELVEMGEPGIRRQEQMTAQAERSLRDLEQSEQDYRQLENDIMDVNQIFKDLSTMVDSQGPTLESIESHVEYTAQVVEAGTTQLTEAHNLKDKLRKKKVYIAIILAIVISIILILIIKHVT